MRNVTITLDESVALWARVWVAQHDTSMSQMIARMLQDRMSAEKSPRKALREFLDLPVRPLNTTGRYPGRTELYDR